MNWQQFVIAHGRNVRTHHLAAIVEQPAEEIERLRGAVRMTRSPSRGFAELFTMWRGRPPTDADWPAPRKFKSSYEWLGPEIVLLASLVGQMGVAEIATVLTEHLRRVTGDATAKRDHLAVQLRINRIGLQTSDVVGGITAADAGKEIGSYAIVHQAITRDELRARRVGRFWVISHDVWREWKATRTVVGPGQIQLSSIRESLGIRSDKLSEFARMGYVPTAIRCRPIGQPDGGHSTQYGTWYIDECVARQLVEDRHAGRPMPWHRKPMIDNLRQTWKLWQDRKHPGTCETCAAIWGQEGAPEVFEDYCVRYPPLDHGAKRHLTMVRHPGLTVAEISRETGRSIAQVKKAIANGQMKVRAEGRRRFVSRTDVTLWKGRKCPLGTSEKSWLSFDSATRQYGFTQAELCAFIASGELATMVGTNGPMRGVQYVSKTQCRHLRDEIGYSMAAAAARVGVSEAELARLLEGVQWRASGNIPLATVQAAIKRKKSNHGFDYTAAAEMLGTTEDWIRERVKDGTVRVSHCSWNDRPYLSKPMIDRLRAAQRSPKVEHVVWDDNWLRQSQAALLAGVSNLTLIRWAKEGDVAMQEGKSGIRYKREDVMARARTYWASVRLKRAVAPKWLRDELRAAGIAA